MPSVLFMMLPSDQLRQTGVHGTVRCIHKRPGLIHHTAFTMLINSAATIDRTINGSSRGGSIDNGALLFAMAANTPINFIMENCFEYPRAFEHNRIFKTKRNDVSGCHDLRYLLEAQSKGLIVAAVVKLPGDDLPKGVYKVLLTCRTDVEAPNNDPRKKKKTAAQEQLDVSTEVWEMVLCDCTKSHSSAQSSKAGCTRLGVLFKFEPVVKTVYDPAVWSDERLADCCKRAYEESTSMGRSRKIEEMTWHWEGKFSENGKDYWMGGFTRGVELKDSKITNFYFCHPDDRELKNVA